MSHGPWAPQIAWAMAPGQGDFGASAWGPWRMTYGQWACPMSYGISCALWHVLCPVSHGPELSPMALFCAERGVPRCSPFGVHPPPKTELTPMDCVAFGTEKNPLSKSLANGVSSLPGR